MFNRSSTYTEGRSVRRSRDARALKNGSNYGRLVEASRWANSEWQYLRLCFEAGAPVPYPVQIMGTEILMEFIEDPESPGAAAPRLQQVQPGPERLQGYWDQLVNAMKVFASLGFAHGDLSPYNVLAAGDRLVIIDLPQFVDLSGNEQVRAAPTRLPQHVQLVCRAGTGRGQRGTSLRADRRRLVGN